MMNALAGELNMGPNDDTALASSAKASGNKLGQMQAVKKLERQTRLQRKGQARLVGKDLDVVNIVRAARKINNLTKVMLTQNQQSMLECQKHDMIESDSENEEEDEADERRLGARVLQTSSTHRGAQADDAA